MLKLKFWEPEEEVVDEYSFLDAEHVDPLNAKGGLAKGMFSAKDYIAPPSFFLGEVEDGDWMKVGDKFVRPFVLHQYPSSVSMRWLDSLYSYKGDMDVAVYIDPANAREATEELNNEIIKIETQIYEERKSGRVSRITKLQNQKEELLRQRMSLERNQEKLFYVQVSTNMYAETLEDLDKRTDALQTQLGGRTMKLMPTYLRQIEGYKTSLPFGRSLLDDQYRNLNTLATSTLFPFYNSEIIHPNGVLVGGDTSTGMPIIMDFYDKKVSTNPNINVFGKSGSGKSYFVSLLTMRSAARGIRTAIIDPEGEFKPVTENLGGSWVDISLDSQSFINPFDVESEYDVERKVERVDIKTKIDEIASLIQVMTSQTEKHVQALILDAVRATYQSFGITNQPESLIVPNETIDPITGEYYPEGRPKLMPTFSDFYKFLEVESRKYDTGQGLPTEMRNLLITLRQFTRGGHMDLFDRQTSPNLKNLKDAPIITFDISQLEESTMRPIGMYIALQWISEKFVKKNPGILKRVVCDEAWMMVNKNMPGYKMTAKFLETLARRIRKRSGGLLVASQNFREFIQTSEGQAVLNNSETRFLLGQDKNDIDSVQQQFKLSDGEANFLQSAQIGEFLVKSTNYSASGYAQPFSIEHSYISQSSTFIGDRSEY